MNKIKIKNTIEYLLLTLAYLSLGLFFLSNNGIAFLYLVFLFIALDPLVLMLYDQIVYRDLKKDIKLLKRFLKGKLPKSWIKELKADLESPFFWFGGPEPSNLKSKEKGDIVIRDESKTLTSKGSE